MELWRSGDPEAGWQRLDVEVLKYGAGGSEARRRRVDVEALR